MKSLKYFSLILATSLILTSCDKDFLETKPTTAVDRGTAFVSTTNAYMALNGMHRNMYQYLGSHGQFGQKSVDMVMDLMGEDMFPASAGYGWFNSDYQYIDARNENSARSEFIWSFYYDLVNNANYILKYVPVASGSDNEKNDLIGQAYAYRAFGLYQNVQVYAKPYSAANLNELGIPVYTEPTSVGKARSTVAETYTQIVKDLDSAIVRLTKTTKTHDKSHISLAVAQGLRARVALTMGDWANAITYAQAARVGFPLMSTDEFQAGFNSVNVGEWMWGSTVNAEQATTYASFFSHMDPFAGGYSTLGGQKVVNSILADQIPATDVRGAVIDNGANTGVNYATMKFYLKDSWAADYLYMRAAEMYLIEAEALAKIGGQDAEAQTVLNILVKKRDASYVKSTNTGVALQAEILLQRRMELWGEGFRFLDLKRLNLGLDRTGANQNPTFAVEMSIPAGDKKFIFLIPKSERDANPLMVQNPL